eukprot:6087074-Amphidinium_carterae.1
MDPCSIHILGMICQTRPCSSEKTSQLRRPLMSPKLMQQVDSQTFTSNTMSLFPSGNNCTVARLHSVPLKTFITFTPVECSQSAQAPLPRP